VYIRYTCLAPKIMAAPMPLKNISWNVQIRM